MFSTNQMKWSILYRELQEATLDCSMTMQKWQVWKLRQWSHTQWSPWNTSMWYLCMVLKTSCSFLPEIMKQLVLQGIMKVWNLHLNHACNVIQINMHKIILTLCVNNSNWSIPYVKDLKYNLEKNTIVQQNQKLWCNGSEYLLGLWTILTKREN